MRHVFQDAEREQILLGLTAVGGAKPVGYLPLYTITDVLGLDPTDLAAQARSRGLSAIVLQPNQCCIKSGALYVYDFVALRLLLDSAASRGLSSGLSTDPDEFVEQIATTWFEFDHPVQPLIQAAFGDRP